MIHIRARRGWRPLDLAELWRFRELLWFLAVRDIKVRYKQTVLGVAWAVLQPLMMMVVFSVLFGRLGGLEARAGDIPYPLFVLIGLLPWQLFSYALTQSSNSLVAEQRLITRVYFPRLVAPLASVLSGIADFAVAFLLLVPMIWWYDVPLSWTLLALPVLVGFAVLSALSVGLWLAALNVQYRDVRYTIPFLTQIWFFVTPVVYPSQIVPEHWQWLFGLNPMAGVVEGFRWCILGQGEVQVPVMIASVIGVTLLFTSGLFYFRRVERTFADVV
jgi:lipopolysaccharide transport system permease protein